MLIDYHGLPAIARLADSADLVDILNSEVDAAGAYGFAQAVVGVIQMVREYALPALDKARRHGLSADMHQSPLVELIIFKVYLARVDSVKDILRPRHEQPDYRALLLGNGVDYPFGSRAFKEHGLAADKKAAEPMHLGARVIERRYAEKNVILGLPVVRLLGLGGVHERTVRMKYRLREACSTRREINCGVIVVGQLDLRRL